MINAFHRHRSIPLLGSLERVAPISRADISTLDNSFHRKKLKSFHNGFLRQTTLLETYEKPGRVDVSVSSSAAATEGKEHIRKRLGIIGCGQMSEALLRGFLSSGVCDVNNISACIRSKKREDVLNELGIETIFDDATKGGASAIAAWSDVLLLGVKPQVLPSILESLAPHIDPERHLVISIAAGVKLSTIQEALRAPVPVIRVMPNTPSLVQAGATAYALGNFASPEDGKLMKLLLGSVGLALEVEEKMLSAVTGVSGSGPAYIYLVIEAMADGGVAAGLPRETALALAAKTVSGAASMVLQENDDSSFHLTHPGVLKDKVTSPLGTTIAAVESLETSGIRGAFIRAVKASAQRSEELG